jgi:hypothetical protein
MIDGTQIVGSDGDKSSSSTQVPVQLILEIDEVLIKLLVEMDAS